MIHNVLDNLYPLLLSTMLYLSGLCYLLLEFVVYVPKMPLWVEPMPSLIHVNPSIFTSHTRLVFCLIIFQHYNFIESEK